jgi:hypothetical protein
MALLAINKYDNVARRNSPLSIKVSCLWTHWDRNWVKNVIVKGWRHVYVLFHDEFLIKSNIYLSHVSPADSRNHHALNHSRWLFMRLKCYHLDVTPYLCWLFHIHWHKKREAYLSLPIDLCWSVQEVWLTT